MLLHRERCDLVGAKAWEDRVLTGCPPFTKAGVHVCVAGLRDINESSRWHQEGLNPLLRDTFDWNVHQCEDELLLEAASSSQFYTFQVIGWLFLQRLYLLSSVSKYYQQSLLVMIPNDHSEILNLTAIGTRHYKLADWFSTVYLVKAENRLSSFYPFFCFVLSVSWSCMLHVSNCYLSHLESQLLYRSLPVGEDILSD